MVMVTLNETADKKDRILTCNLAASNQTSSLLGHWSQPALINFLAVTIRPACSSKQAAAIHPGACFGFDFTRESKSILARLMSPISASVLRITLSNEVRYPLGSTDVAEPEVVEVPEICARSQVVCLTL
jgi:hypothetical protein